MMTDLDAVWTAAARALGADLTESDNARASTPVLTTEVDGVALTAGLAFSGTDQITWASCDAMGAFGLRLVASTSGRYPFVDTFSITCGDAEFDRRFVTRTNDAPFARLWLDRAVRDAITRSPGYHFIVADERCRAWRPGEESDAEQLTAALRAVLALGRRGARIRAEWRRLADHLSGRIAADERCWRPDGALSIEVELTAGAMTRPGSGATVTVDGFFGALGRRRPGKGLFTRLRCPRVTTTRDPFAVCNQAGRRALRPGSELPRCEITGLTADYLVEAEAPERLQVRFDSALCQRIAAAAPEVIIADPDQVTLFFLGFETDPVRIRDGLEIVAALAIETALPGSGPYR